MVYFFTWVAVPQEWSVFYNSLSGTHMICTLFCMYVTIAIKSLIKKQVKDQHHHYSQAGEEGSLDGSE